MLNEIKKDAQTRMAKSVEAFRHTLIKIRTGRASTALVDHLKVNYYGSDMPLSQVASVAVTMSQRDPVILMLCSRLPPKSSRMR